MKQAPSTLLPSILELINDGKLSLAKKLLENVAFSFGITTPGIKSDFKRIDILLYQEHDFPKASELLIALTRRVNDILKMEEQQ